MRKILIVNTTTTSLKINKMFFFAMDLFIVVVFQYLRSTLAKACNATPNLMSAGSTCCFEQHFSGRPQLVIMDSNIQHIENLPPVRDPSILSEEYNFHKWYIDFLKANNYGESELNCGYVKDLRGFVHVQKNQHAHCPKDKLTRQEFCHILAYLVSKMPFENVSPKPNTTTTASTRICSHIPKP